ncbi:hypothetical protein H8E77_09020 [bacterium]|nr:hypothetical protein [bacterium]
MQTLQGIIDIHAHAAPDKTHRSIDILELAKLYKDRGVRAMVIMNHFDPTAGLAYLAGKHAPGLEVFGGIVLNQLVGGINPAAVEHFIRVEGEYGKIVYMPTLDSENEIRHSKSSRPFVRISKDGQLLPEVLDMLDLIAKHKLILSTGHSSPEEVLLLTQAAKEQGVEKILATNPMFPSISMSVEQMREAAQLGAYIEFIYYSVGMPGAPVTMKDYADAIKTIGPERCILSSCGGQAWMPIHTFAWEELFRGMREHGLTEEIERMAKVNPAHLLGLE